MTVRLYEGDELAFGAQIALDRKLWVPGWAMRPALAWLAASTKHQTGFHHPKIAISFENREPVAVVLFNGEWLMAFCKRTHRRQGHAAACLKAMGDVPSYAKTAEGVPGSGVFWENNGHPTIPRDEAFCNSIRETMAKGEHLIDYAGYVYPIEA